jgi:hypothetical protein
MVFQVNKAHQVLMVKMVEPVNAVTQADEDL